MIPVEIEFQTRKLQWIFNSAVELKKEYGNQMARCIMLRIAVLRAPPTLAEVPTCKPIRCHALKGDRKGCFAVDLVQPYRLLFRPYVESIPCKADGGLDLSRVNVIQIVEVVDYHN
ncbi:MAG TPA: killer suppression protein [bacterium]|nr:killer suppression protein [bacterium]HQL63283.1 killer suppression protein [bacterium]